MAFDKDVFLASFIDQFSSGIGQRQEEARRYKEQQEAAFERNQQLIQQRRMRANQAAQLGKQAMQLGASQEQVRTAMSSGVSGIQTFYDKLQEAANQQGMKTLGVDDIEALVTMSTVPGIKDSMTDKTLEQFAMETYGAAGKAAPQEERGGFFASLLDPRGRVKQQLRETDGMAGMSIADVNAAARQAEYQSLFGDATVTYTDIDYFTSEKAYEFSTKMADIADDAVKTDAAEAYIKAERRKGTTMEESDRLEKAARKEIIESALEPYIEYYGDTYQHGGFFENKLAKRQIIDLMGDEWWDDFSSAYAKQSPESEEEEPQEGDLDLTKAKPADPPSDKVEPRPEGSAPEYVSKTFLEKGFSGSDKKIIEGATEEQKEWDEKYAGKFNPDGTPILVEPRPDEDEVILVERSFIEKGYRGSGKKRVSAAEEWDKKYGDTHNPDGTPKLESE